MKTFFFRLLVALTPLCALPASAQQSPSLPDTIVKIKASVVAIGTYQPTANPQFQARGTGFAVGDGRTIVTNAHGIPRVLNPAANEKLAVLVTSGTDKATQLRMAELVASDPTHDTAILRIEGAPLPALALRKNPHTVREGQDVAFTGYALGQALALTPTTHRAIVAAVTAAALPTTDARGLNEAAVKRLRESAVPVFQLDATAYPGHSGSPLYDLSTQEVIGILSFAYVKGGRESAISRPSGISYALPIVYAAELLERTPAKP